MCAELRAEALGEGPQDSLLAGSASSSSGSLVQKPVSPCRRFLLRLVTHKAFDSFVLLVIILNCMSMASRSPLEPERGTPKAEFLKKAEFIFNVIFTIEMLLKMAAYGIGGYLNDLWNGLDFTVVTMAWAPLIFPGLGNYSAIRAFRVVRALRTVNRVPALRKIIVTLLSSIPQVWVAIVPCARQPTVRRSHHPTHRHPVAAHGRCAYILLLAHTLWRGRCHPFRGQDAQPMCSPGRAGAGRRLCGAPRPSRRRPG